MAARYDSNHFQLLSYRIWEEYRALSAAGAAIPPNSTATLVPDSAAPPDASEEHGALAPTTEGREDIGTERAKTNSADSTPKAELSA